MPSKTAKKSDFRDALIAKIEEYMDQAFATDDPDKRQQYREAIRELEKLLITISDLG